MSISPDPKERELYARYQRVKKAFQEGEYAQALNLLAGLPQDYLDAHTDIKSDVQSITRNAKLGQVLSRIGILNTLCKQFDLSWTWFTTVFVVVASVVIIGVALFAGASMTSCSVQATPTTTIIIAYTDTPTPSRTLLTSTIAAQVPTGATKPPTEPLMPEITEIPTEAEESSSTATTAPPGAPTNLKVISLADTSITLSWSNAGDQTKVVIKRSGNIVAELLADSRNYTDNGLACGSSYDYELVAVNEAGESEPAQITAQTKECPPPPPPSSLSGKIAVPVFDTNAGTYNIYIARASDSWQPKLFFQNGSQPAFSPDGRQIILRSWRQAEQGFGQRLVLFPSLGVDAGDERLMTYHLEDAHPSLNRNGDIVFHTRREGSPILVTLGTWPGAESDIANQHKLGPGENPDWLGNRIVYYAPGPPSGLYAMNADGSNVQLALSEPGSLAPAAAPDGDHVAVSLQRGGRWHVFTLSASQGENSLTQLTNENADDQLPVWSPDGKFIAFVSNRGGKWAVWVMPAPGAQVQADGTDQRKLFDLNGPIDGTVSIAPNMSYGWGEERLSWAP